jgi:hypothetical protein
MADGGMQARVVPPVDQAMVAYSTSAMVFSRSAWNGPGRTHAVLYSPMLDSMVA